MGPSFSIRETSRGGNMFKKRKKVAPLQLFFWGVGGLDDIPY